MSNQSLDSLLARLEAAQTRLQATRSEYNKAVDADASDHRLIDLRQALDADERAVEGLTQAYNRALHKRVDDLQSQIDKLKESPF